jgi:hypothetical protein
MTQDEDSVPKPKGAAVCRRYATRAEADPVTASQHEPEILPTMVLTTLEELVNVGLGARLDRADGVVEFHLLGGARWLLDVDGVTRVA